MHDMCFDYFIWIVICVGYEWERMRFEDDNEVGLSIYQWKSCGRLKLPKSIVEIIWESYMFPLNNVIS